MQNFRTNILSFFMLLCFPYQKKKIEMLFFIHTEDITLTTTNMSLSQVLSDISLGITVYDKKIKKYNKLLKYAADCSELEIEYLKYAIKLVQVEKLIFQSALKDNNSILFPKLLSKCDEIIGDIIDISSQRTKLSEVNEGQHLITCNEYLKRRENIKYLCEFASKKNK